MGTSKSKLAVEILMAIDRIEDCTKRTKDVLDFDPEYRFPLTYVLRQMQLAAHSCSQAVELINAFTRELGGH